jgi:hypothetical protein
VKLTILTPKLTDPSQFEDLKTNSRFVMRGKLRKGSTFLDVVNVPTIMEMVGMSSGGGPPGFSYIESDNEEYDHILFVLMAPNQSIGFPCEARGVVQCLGMLFLALTITGDEKFIDGAVDSFKTIDEDVMVLDLIVYEHPDLLKQRAFPRVGL